MRCFSLTMGTAIGAAAMLASGSLYAQESASLT
jgi:hypothetical protein